MVATLRKILWKFSNMFIIGCLGLKLDATNKDIDTHFIIKELQKSTFCMVAHTLYKYLSYFIIFIIHKTHRACTRTYNAYLQNAQFTEMCWHKSDVVATI